MDTMTNKPLFEETGSHDHIYVYLIMLKYIIYNILRSCLYNIASAMLKFSLFFEYLSEKFITNEHLEELPEHPIQNRFDGYLSIDQNNKNTKQTQTKNEITDDKSETKTEPNSEINEEMLEEKSIITTKIDASHIVNKHNWKMQIITKTLRDNEQRAKFNMDDEIYKSMNNVDQLHQTKERTPRKNERKHSFKQESEYNSYLALTPKRNDTYYRSINNDQSTHKNEKSMNCSIKSFKINDVYDNIFDLPPEISLALLVTEDLQMTTRISFEFKYLIGQVGVLMDQNLQVGDVGEIVHDEQHIFYLVVRRKFKITPMKKDLEIACFNLLKKMNDYKLTKLAIPKSGLDHFTLQEVKEIFSKVFFGTGIEISLYSSPRLDIEHLIPPKINSTSRHLWEMEPQTDLIMFINMNQMYMNDWNDVIVENINAKYPFKDRLLEDINIKPVAAGDLLSYTIGTELLICIFVKPMDSSYFECLEKAFIEMKSLMPGYRYLGIQYVSDSWKSYSNIPRTLLLLRSMFDKKKAEIWICGDTKHDKSYEIECYNRLVQNAIARNERSIYLPVNRMKTEGHRCNNITSHGNANTTPYSVIEKNQKISDNKYATLPVEEVYVAHNIEENWDHYNKV